MEVNSYFEVDYVSGDVTLSKAFDREKIQTYEFDIRAKDLGANALATNCKVN